jgi:hypothetical protein
MFKKPGFLPVDMGPSLELMVGGRPNPDHPLTKLAKSIRSAVYIASISAMYESLKPKKPEQQYTPAYTKN